MRLRRVISSSVPDNPYQCGDISAGIGVPGGQNISTYKVGARCGRYHRVITTLKYSKNRVKPTVVNGEPAEHWQVPYLVSIKEPSIDGKQISSEKDKLWLHLCGGSIISISGKILTAAHCFEADRYRYKNRPYLLRAVAGSTDTDIVHSGRSSASPTGQWRTLTKAILHPEFNFPYNDIALARIDSNWDWNRGLKPIPLPWSTADELQLCYTAGYGRVGHEESDKSSSVLLLAPMEIMSREQCSVAWEMDMDKFVCTSSTNTDVSEGDSGGPLTCNTDGDTLVGIVSGKNFDKTTIFTRVSAFSDWINNEKFSNTSRLHSGAAKHYAVRLTWTVITFFLFGIKFCF